MAITYKSGWNAQITSYANKYGPYQAFLSSFDENTLNRALSDAKNKFIDPWVSRFIDAAMDPFNKKSAVTVEQGAHQTDDTGGAGFCLHSTGRDQNGHAFHFYVNQKENGSPRIFKITYMDKGKLVSCNTVN